MAQLAIRAWPYAAVGAPGAWAVYLHFWKRGGVSAKQRADVVRVTQEVAASMLDELHAELKRVQARVRDLETEMAQMQRDHSESSAAKDAKITMLEGELRQERARSAGLEHLLEANGIPLPSQARPHFEVIGGELR